MFREIFSAIFGGPAAPFVIEAVKEWKRNKRKATNKQDRSNQHLAAGVVFGPPGFGVSVLTQFFKKKKKTRR